MYHKTLIKFSFEEWVYLKKSYSKHFGVFMDILGYKNLVMEAEKNITEAVHIIDNIEQMIKRCILSKYAWMMNYHHIRLAPIFGEKICIQQECRNKVKEKLGLHLADLIC